MRRSWCGAPISRRARIRQGTGRCGSSPWARISWKPAPLGGTLGCKPDLIIDRLRYPGETHDGIIDNLIMFTTVRAVEVYHAISGTPPEFMRAGNYCGTIVIWTGYQ